MDPREEIAELFSLFDIDGTGVITRDNLRWVRTRVECSPSATQLHFARPLLAISPLFFRKDFMRMFVLCSENSMLSLSDKISDITNKQQREATCLVMLRA